MNGEDCKVLFEALSQILSNQKELSRHLEATKYDRTWGWGDDDTSKAIEQCDYIAEKYND